MSDTPFLLADWISTPGDTLAEILEERGFSPLDLAAMLEEKEEFSLDLLAGREHVTEEIARRLGNTLGTSAAFWLAREEQYREKLAQLAEFSTDPYRNWLAELPVRDMLRLHWIEPVAESALASTLECLRFFEVSSLVARKIRSATSSGGFSHFTILYTDPRVGCRLASARRNRIGSADMQALAG